MATKKEIRERLARLRKEMKEIQSSLNNSHVLIGERRFKRNLAARAPKLRLRRLRGNSRQSEGVGRSLG